MDKGLIANIIRPDGTDYSNGGVSSRCHRVVVMGVNGPFWPRDDAPAVRLVVRDLRHLGAGMYVHAEPCAPAGPDTVGAMMGGTFIWASDSRFAEAVRELTGGRGQVGPIPLHDRFETRAQYAAYDA